MRTSTTPLLLCLFLTFTMQLLGQNNSAIVDYESDNQGILIPRMTPNQWVSISDPAEGLMVYDSVNHSFYFFNGDNWQTFNTGPKGDKGTGISTISSTDNGNGTFKITFAMSNGTMQEITSPVLTGPKGDTGAKGDIGATGPAGTKGDTGAVGAAGATGDQGIQGPQGATGTTGAKGDTGVTGATGMNGADGMNGAKGDKGDTGDAGMNGMDGAKGDKGDTGDAGTNGMDGMDGAKGDKGDTGDAGMNGMDGAKGDKGDTGDTGMNGMDGMDGAKGDKGDTGDAGMDGAKGDKGDTGDAGMNGMDGAKGDKGDTGDAGMNGAISTISSTNNGDGTFMITFAMSNGTTQEITSPVLTGPKGDTGAKGDIGATGPAGVKGDTGAVGAAGATGDQGIQGPQGATGTTGAKGDTGATGATGMNGADGMDGAKGDKGDKGDTGDAGMNGANGMAGMNGTNGMAGTNGTNGKTILNGIINPTDMLGTEGDFYLNTITDTLFGPKTSTAWPTPGTSLVGPKGDFPDLKEPLMIADDSLRLNIKAPLLVVNDSLTIDTAGVTQNQTLIFNGDNWVAGDVQYQSSNTGSQQPFSIRDPYLAINYIIALQGTFPSRNFGDPFIASVVLFAGNFAPRSWAFCAGQLLPISSNTALFSLIGTIYGGDGRTTMALPDLRGRSAIGPGNGPGLSSFREGDRGGRETVTLTTLQLPPHNHIITKR